MERARWALDTPLVNVNADDIKLSSAIDEVKSAVKRKEADIYWGNKMSTPQNLSFKDKMAAAQRKVDEYDQSRVTPTQAKPKSKGMEI